MAAGNCTQLKINGIAQQNFTYDDENRVSQIDYPSAPALPSSHFGYNGQRLRTSRQDSHGLAKYVTDGDSPGADVLSDGQAVYTPGVSERRNGASRFLHRDANGSLRGLTNSSQQTTDTLVQDAFGVTVGHTGSNPLPFGFEADAQYQLDSDSSLLLVGNRYYDPVIGRFIPPDPSGEEDNEYAYADNNPLSFNDPDGLQARRYGPQTKKKTRRKGSSQTPGRKPRKPQAGKRNQGGKTPDCPPSRGTRRNTGSRKYRKTTTRHDSKGNTYIYNNNVTINGNGNQVTIHSPGSTPTQGNRSGNGSHNGSHNKHNKVGNSSGSTGSTGGSTLGDVLKTLLPIIIPIFLRKG